ncbi:conserved hypothetical protein [Desulfosarcina cetonica]|uniref:hypothetical protein n=1 Tax=Desulfosarcina cetonica TaxID=90730 RepID=UPI0012EDDDB2|nr:hypothetical protein [Desulfosarcina cetonica]VTR66059.1 conserved hypothetical protein [Desulfosarcina cetonica]
MSNKAIEAWKSSLPKGKHIFVSAGVKNIHPVMDRIVNRLLAINRIQYVRITPSDIQASSEITIRGKAKIPISTPSHPTAIGVHLIFEPAEKYVQFHEITSSTKGYGGRIVQAVMDSIPEDWEALVMLDYSDGFWDKMMEKYDKILIL